jgi:hypothetical protein
MRDQATVALTRLPIKPLSIAVQVWAVELVAAMNFRRAFPGMRESEVERTKRALKDAAATLSQLTDW